MGSKWAADHIHYWNWKLSEVGEAVWHSECKKLSFAVSIKKQNGTVAVARASVYVRPGGIV